MELDKAIKLRKSVKKFSDKKPDWREIIECIDSTRYAPRAGNNFTLKFILVDDKEIIKKIAKYSEQPFVEEVHYILVACSNPSRTVNSYGKRGEVYSRQQAGAAIENFLLKIQEKKLSTCWIGHFEDNLIKKLLKVPSNVNIEALFPIGYELGKTTKRMKIELDTILYFNDYKNKKIKKPKRLEV